MFALDPEDRHFRGKFSFWMQAVFFFTCALHGPLSGKQVALTHSTSSIFILNRDDHVLRRGIYGG